MQIKKVLLITFLFLASLGSLGGILLLRSVSCYSAAIQISPRNNFPITSIQMGHQHYPVYLGIGGSPSFFALQSSILESTKQPPCDSTERQELDGKTYSVQSFVLPQIKVGKLKICHVKAEEWFESLDERVEQDQMRPVGEIGSKILEKTNLILDFPHSKIWMVEDFRGLHRARFNENEMIKVPFEIWDAGILLKVGTDVGKMTLFLSTKFSNTVLKLSILEGKAQCISPVQTPVFSNAKFSIGGKDFGPLPLYSFDIPSDWDEIDGILGMDFLSQHVIYIDYKKKELYIGYSTRDICKALPVRFSSANLPIIDAFLGEKRRSLMFDTGSSFQLSLNNHVLKSLKRKEIGRKSYTNLREETFQTKLFSIDDLRFGDLTFSAVQAIETKEEFSKSTRLGEVDLTDESEIGRFVLEKINLLLDFPHRKLWQIGGMDSLKKIGFDPDKMVKVPFDLTHNGMIVDAVTEVGKFRLVFDTGSTFTIVKSQSLEKFTLCEGGIGGLSFYRSEKFDMGNKDFGQLNIYSWDIYPTSSEVDGVLGMNFIRQHVIYIDYPNRMLYITNPD